LLNQNLTSSLGKKIGRAGNILRRTTLARIADYEERFSKISHWYDLLLKDLLIDSYSVTDACETARQLFGKDKVNFVAIDGTEYSKQLFDMVVFFAGSYSCEGSIDFSDNGLRVSYKDRFMDEGRDVSSCVPIYINKIPEIDQTFTDLNVGEVNVMKPLTEEMILDNTNIANSLMTFSEYYLAYRFAKSDNTDIIFLDRSLSNTYPSLVYDTSMRRHWGTHCSLINYEIDDVPVDINDLTICRHNVINGDLDLIPTRGDYLRYAVIFQLLKYEEMSICSLSEKLGVGNDEKISKRVQKYIKRWVQEGVIEETNEQYRLINRYRSSWDRIRKLVTHLGDQLFEGDDPFIISKGSEKEWITTLDLAFLTLFSLYMLIEECWKNKILLIGLTKDTAAHDFKNHVIPICLNNGIWPSKNVTQESLDEIPNTDRMFLQSISMSNEEELKIPWSLVEYDAAFVTAIPDFKNRMGYISGAIRNRITPSKMFVRSFVQLQRAKNDAKLRSNVLAIDRLVYPEFDIDKNAILDFKHEFGGEESIQLILFKDKRVKNPIQNLVVTILKSMSAPSIAEAFGHNKALYIADKVAKWHNEQFRKIVNSTGSMIISDKGLRKYVFYMNSFREKREAFETNRKN
jgi:hypothetical protein